LRRTSASLSQECTDVNPWWSFFMSPKRKTNKKMTKKREMVCWKCIKKQEKKFEGNYGTKKCNGAGTGRSWSKKMKSIRKHLVGRKFSSGYYCTLKNLPNFVVLTQPNPKRKWRKNYCCEQRSRFFLGAPNDFDWLHLNRYIYFFASSFFPGEAFYHLLKMEDDVMVLKFDIVYMSLDNQKRMISRPC
jgi:hypothetical protein